jgi:hypothetical protein
MAGFGSLGHFARTVLGAVALAISTLGAPALAQPAMWVIKDADSTIYLLGTVHVLKPDMQWETPRLNAAIAASDTLWQELPTSDPAALVGELLPVMVKHGYSQDTKLTNLLSPAEMKTLDAAAKLAGLSGAALNRMRPWNAALNISNAAVVRAGFDPMSGVDGQIERKFKTRGIKPNGFESAEQQIMIFATMEEEEELSFLRETLKEYQNASTEVEKLVSGWAAGDVEALNAMFVGEAKAEGGAFYDELFTNRNRNWTSRIETMLAGKGVTFIAVGAGHLIGEDSVIAMLAAKGVKAERYQ